MTSLVGQTSRSARDVHVPLFVFALLMIVSDLPLSARTITPFDADWRFTKSDPPAAERPEFDDTSWRTLSLPHDWSIEGPFDQKNPAGGAGAWLPAGVGWYRKHFSLPASKSPRRFFIDFDGVMANSDVWINGFHLGKRPYGYVSFEYDLTAHLNFGAKTDNVLAVRVDNSGQPASRWYAGAGIYRHVRLASTDPVHLEHWATFITTPKPNVVHVATSVINQSSAPHKVAITVQMAGPRGFGTVVGTPTQTIAPGKSATFEKDIAVNSPVLWDLTSPTLYAARIYVDPGRNTIEDEVVYFGIRDFRFDPDTGFWLNGQNFKIKGVCLHHDGGAFGAAVPLSVWRYRLTRLKELGVNAIRTAHNPPAPEFLDLCDQMGFLVMEEMFDCWTVAKNPSDYHLYFGDWSQTDTRDTVMRDRNHPSVILYSAGNEIHDTPKADLAKEILGGLVKVFHATDPTRPVTQALFRPNVSHDYDDGLADMLDVIGQNYRENEILDAHTAKPSRKIIGTENQHGRNVWVALRDNPPYAGQFLWAGIDYLGESRFWPVTTAAAGLLDRTGGFKPIAYERQSWWSDQPMVYMARRVAPPPAPVTDPGYEVTVRRRTQNLFPDWTPAQPSAAENVEVYSNCEEVELLLNGKSLGSKPRPGDASPRNWSVPFEPGVLKAVGRNRGDIAASFELHTAGKPAKVVLSSPPGPLPADWDHVAFITAQVVDDHGQVVPSADQSVDFQVTGPAEVVAVDNADIASHEPFQASTRRAFHGECVAVVRAKSNAGQIRISASAPGLSSASIIIR